MPNASGVNNRVKIMFPPSRSNWDIAKPNRTQAEPFRAKRLSEIEEVPCLFVLLAVDGFVEVDVWECFVFLCDVKIESPFNNTFFHQTLKQLLKFIISLLGIWYKIVTK